MGKRIMINDQLNESYYHQLQRHIAQVRAALLAPEKKNDDDDDAFDDTLLSPAAYWTAHEKELFFHALTRHSRLRPDLISASIKTKNVVEVCAYMEALESAAEELDEEGHGKDISGGQEVLEEDGEVDREDAEDEEPGQEVVDAPAAQTARPRGRGVHRWAREMSDDWVGFEENQAELLTLEEQYELNQDHINNSRRRSSSMSSADSEELLTPGRTFTSFDLEAMESFLREAEDSSTELKVVPEELKAKFQTTTQGTRSLSRSLTPAASARHSADNHSSPDPRRQDHHYHHPAGSPATPDRTGVQIGEEADGRGEDAEGGRKEEGNHDELEESEEEAIPVDLSPASRRRLQKRLYMRRQRALKAGREVDLTSVKLRPGRKTKLRPPKKKKRRNGKKAASTPPPSPSPAKDDEDVEMEEAGASSPPPYKRDEEEYGHPNKGGLTGYSRAKQELLKTGVDGERLIEEGIGFFHLTALSRLIKILNSGYREPLSTSSVLSLLDAKGPPVISADVIQMLTAVTVEFVAEVVHRALAIGEQQVSYKRNTKVWRASDNEHVSTDQVKLAIEMMGLDLRSRREFMAEIAEDSEEEEDESPPKGSGIFPLDSDIHMELHEPQIYLPRAYRTRHQADDINNIAVDDEYELLKELREEEDLDTKELTISREYEAELWEGVYQ